MFALLPPPVDDKTGWLRKVYEAVNSLRDGRVNCIGTVTLANSVTTTTVTDLRCSVNSVVLLSPSNAAAGAEAWSVVPANGSFVITHSNAVTTRTFKYVMFG